MNFLYLLTEDSNDDLFYELCAERISGLKFHQINPRRIRKNGGVHEVLKKLQAFVNDLKSAQGYESAFFIIAVDNDRAPVHPNHDRISGLTKADASKSCRSCLIQKELEKNWEQIPKSGRLRVL